MEDESISHIIHSIVSPYFFCARHYSKFRAIPVNKAGMWVGTAVVENSIKTFQKIKSGIAIWFGSPSSGCLSGGGKASALGRCLYSHVHCSNIHNGQDAEAAWVSVDG